MKKLKKLLSIVLVLTMVLSLNVVSFASTGTYTITITGDVSTEYVYTAYQIFAGELDESGSTAVLSNITWGSNVDKDATYSTYADIYEALATIKDENGGLVFVDDNNDPLDSAAKVAAALGEYADDTDDTVVKAFAAMVANYLTGTGTDSDTGSTTYTISGLEAGYYLVVNTTVPDDGAYTSYILRVVKSVTVTTKKDIPQVDKDLSDVDANIGDTITYYLTASLPSYLDDYDEYLLRFTDTLCDGLTYISVSGVYVYNDSDLATNKANAIANDLSAATEVYSGDYTVDTSSIVITGGGSFSVEIEDVKDLTTDGTTAISVDKNSLIQVVFTATLNSNAVIAGEGNSNEVYLEYSNNPNGSGEGKTTTDYVYTWTYEIDVTKQDGDSKDVLPGAKFVLYRVNATSGNKEYVVVDSNSKVVEWTENEWDSGETTVASVFESDASGLFSVIGLDVGTYYLEEIEAPSGYNLLDDPLTITISATYSQESSTWLTDDKTALTTLTADSPATVNADNDVELTIDNNKGSSLPETGGIGTTIFYVVGGILILGAVVLLITKKRMNSEER